jgi:hypothetical protein
MRAAPLSRPVSHGRYDATVHGGLLVPRLVLLVGECPVGAFAAASAATGTVTAAQATVRAEPGTTAGVLTTLAQGATFPLCSVTG